MLLVARGLASDLSLNRLASRESHAPAVSTLARRALVVCHKHFVNLITRRSRSHLCVRVYKLFVLRACSFRFIVACCFVN